MNYNAGMLNTNRKRTPRRYLTSSSDESVPFNITTRRRRAYRIASDSGEFSGSVSNSSSSNNCTDSGHVKILRRKRENPYMSVSDIDSNDSDSSSSDSRIFLPTKKKKCILVSDNDNSSSSSDSDSEIIRVRTTTKRKQAFVINDDMSNSSSSSSDSIILRPSSSSRRPPIGIVSDDEDNGDGLVTGNDNRSTSESPIPVRNPRVPRLISSDDSSDSSSSTNKKTQPMRTVGQTLPSTHIQLPSTFAAVPQSMQQNSGSDEGLFEEFDDSQIPEKEKRKKSVKTKPNDGDASSSSDGDDQAECCPICFRKLKTQELGTPEACDHTFCVICLKEWAKNVNTCPVDRQRFSLILVRKSVGGKIIGQIPVENVEPPQGNVIDDDPTYCEICGECDREDRMMLCDGCDLGFHLECLTPPLHTIPIAEWYCPSCSVMGALGDHIEEVVADSDEEFGNYFPRRQVRNSARRVHHLRPDPSHELSESDDWNSATRSSIRNLQRLIPRTRQSQRIIALVNSNNFQNESSENDVHFNEDGSEEETNCTVTTTQNSNQKKTGTPSSRRKPRQKKRRKRKNCRFKIKLITTEEGVIEVKLPRKRKKRYRKRKKTRQSAGHPRVLQKKTVKERLAKKLGIMCNNRRGSCSFTGSSQNESQALSQPQSSHSSFSQAIPTLDLFGNHNQLDDFSGYSDEDDLSIGGSNEIGQVLTQHNHRTTISSNLRTMSRKKAVALLSRSQLQARSGTAKKKPVDRPAASTKPAGSSLLDSILDSQTKWHSKNSEIIHNHTDGSVSVKVTEKRVDVNKENGNCKTTKTPLYPGSSNSHGSRFSSYDYQSRDRNISGGRPTDMHSGNPSSSFPSSNLSSFPSSRAGFTSNYGIGISPFTGAAPIRFRMNLPPRRPNIHTNPVPPLRQPPFPDPQLFTQEPSPSNSPNEEEEVDIYSDIEPERTTDNDGEEGGEKSYGTLEPPPEPPALLMGLGQDDIDEEHDEGGLVIDDQPLPPQQPPLIPPPPAEEYDPAEPCEDSNSSDGFDEKNHPNYGMYPTVGPLPDSTLSSKPIHSDDDDEDEEDGNDADCPNFSMYSAASMNIAHKNDEMQLKKLKINDDDEEEEEDVSSLPSVDEKYKNNDEMIDVPLPPEDEDVNDKNDTDEVKETEKLSKHKVSDEDFDDEDDNDDDDDEDDDDEEDDGDDDDDDDDDADADCNKVINEKDETDDNKESNENEGNRNDSRIKNDTENTLDIPIPEDLKEEDIPIPADINNEDIPIPENNDNNEKDIDIDEENDAENVKNKKNNDNSVDFKSSVSVDKLEQIKFKNVVRSNGNKDIDGEDECSTQDVLDLAIGSEGNLQDNLANDENEEPSISIHMENPEELEEGIDKIPDAGEKPDGLVDITDEEMSVYDGQDNSDNLEKLSDNDKENELNDSQKDIDMFDSDDNSLVGGATSAVSAGTLNNSDNQPVSTLPGLEGLETETISESEDVNFDELPDGIQNEEHSIQNEEYSSSKRKKKKKTRKTASMSETEDANGKGQLDTLEFEEGEIIEDKPKQSSKKDKKSKGKHEKDIDKEEAAVTNAVTAIPQVNKEAAVVADKKQKKKKEKKDSLKDKSAVGNSTNKSKDPKIKEKTVKAGEVDENIAWKKPSKSTKERNYRDGKEKEKDDKKQEPAKKEKKNKEKRKELERYDVRRLISEKPKRPRKDEFGRDLSPSKSRSLTPPRYRNRSPLRVRNRSRSRSWRSRSRSRGRIRRSRSRGRFRSRSRERGRSRSRERIRRSRSRNRRSRSKDRRRSKSKDKTATKAKKRNRTVSRTRRRTKSRSPLRPSRRQSRSYSQSWSPSWSGSSMSRSRSASPRTGRTRSLSRSLSRSWSRGREGHESLVDVGHKNTRKNLTVIVTNKDAVRKKDKKKTTKKKDDKRKRRRGQSPAPSKEVFTSGDNILVSVNFKSNRGTAEIVPATTPVLRESSKRKRDDVDPVSGKRKKDKSSKENVPVRNKSGQKGLVNKSTRLTKLNEAMKNAKPVAIIDLDMSPFREQTPSPKEVIILSDSGEENDKQQKEMEKQLERLGEGMSSSRLSLDTDHQQNTSVSQPESPSTHSFMMTSTGPKTPPEPHVKFSIVSNKPQLRVLTNPLMECDEELRRDEATETDMDEVMHKGPNTPPEPPPDLNTPASPPTTPYDPFDPTKSRSPSPQPPSDSGLQVNSSREDKSVESSSNLQGEILDDGHGTRILEHRTLTPPVDSDELKKTPEPLKVLSTPKLDQSGIEVSPKHQSPASVGVEPTKSSDDSLLKPFQKLLSTANKIDVPVHKSPEKLIVTVGNMVQQQMNKLNQTPSKQLGVIKKPANLVPVYTPSMTLNSSKSIRTQQNGAAGDQVDDVLDLDAGSPYSPGSSEGDDLFDPPPMTPPRPSKQQPPLSSASKPSQPKTTAAAPSTQNKFDLLFSSSPMKLPARHGKHHGGKAKKGGAKGKGKAGTGRKEVGVKLDEDQLKILDELPSSAVEMQVKDKFLKKLNRQERVVEEVKLVLKPHYAKKHITKEDYKEILRRAVPKICHNKSGEINPMKIQCLIEAYVKKFRKMGAGKKKPAAVIQNAVPANKPKVQKTMWS